MQHRLSTCLFLLSTIAVAACSSDWQPEGEPVDNQQWDVHKVCGAGDVGGIDVSSWQDTVDWAKVKTAGVQFGIARVTHGTGTIDAQFAANWKGMKANGIIRGAYQYFEPAQGGLEQAKLFVSKIQEAGGFEDGDLPGVIDVESVDGATSAQTIAEVHNWIDYVESQTNRKPIIYSGSYFWDDHTLGSDFASYPLWGPNYTYDTSVCHLISSAWTDWTFWQYSDQGSVSGISGNVDLDRYNGSLADLQAFIKASIITPPDGPEPGPEPQPEAGPDAEPEASVEAASPEAQPKDSAVSDSAGDEQTPPVADAAHDAAKGAWQSEGDDGCGCRTAGRSTTTGAALLALALGAMLGARRRRSRIA